MWKTQTIYLIIKTQRFKWFLDGNNKLHLLYQIVDISKLHHDVIEICDVKYLCLNFCKSVEKNNVESRNFKSILGRRSANAIQGSHMANPQKESFQKYIRCRVMEDQNRKVNRLKLPMLFEVTLSDGMYVNHWKYAAMLNYGFLECISFFT